MDAKGLPCRIAGHTWCLFIQQRRAQEIMFPPMCVQIARRYGSMYVDAKVAVDGVFAALGKPLPEPAPAEDKTPPQGKGKKGKDTKKGENNHERLVPWYFVL